MNRKMYVSRNIEEEKEKKFFSEWLKEKNNDIGTNILFNIIQKKEINKIIELEQLPELVKIKYLNFQEVEFYGRVYSIIRFKIEIGYSEDNFLISEETSFILNSEEEKKFVLALVKGEEITICSYQEIYEDKYFTLTLEFEKNEELLEKIKDIEVREITIEEEIDVLSIFNKAQEDNVVEKKDLSEDNLRKMMNL